ncbi:DinB family protein [Sporosarcina sp. CAU 1771]
MFNSIEDFLVNWEIESQLTQKVLDELTDESLMQKVSPEGRSLGRIAWHIVTTLDEMLAHAELEFEAARDGDPVPTSAARIAEAYRSSSKEMVKAMKEQWSDATLEEVKDMYGEKWRVSKILWIVFVHQVHHRGQMTVLMRQAGLRVPGVCGPSREEWAAFGGQAPE